MKKLLSILFAGIISLAGLQAQRCFDMHTAVVTELNAVPNSSMESFKVCSTKPGERSGTKDIVDYGANYKKIDDFIKQKTADFSNASFNNLAAPQAPSASQTDDARQLAETLNGMTDEQKKAFAMKMAQQQMQNRGSAPAIQDDAATMTLVGKTAQLASLDLTSLIKEYTNKFDAISNTADSALQNVKEPPCNCPSSDNITISCACANKFHQPFLKQKVDIIDKYNRQKISLYNEYLPKVKALCTQIDANITTLKMGDAIKTPNLKKQLFSTQAGAFAMASQFALSEENIRKTGADVYVYYYNSVNGVFTDGCFSCF